MKGFLLDENLPYRLSFMPSFPSRHASEIAANPSDSELWNHAKVNDLVIVTKDADFSDRILISTPPPRIIHLRFGNLRRSDFHRFLERIWPRLEILAASHKLVNVYLDRIETVR